MFLMPMTVPQAENEMPERKRNSTTDDDSPVGDPNNLRPMAILETGKKGSFILLMAEIRQTS